MFSLKYLCLSTILLHVTKAAEIQTLIGDAHGFRPHVHKYLVMLHMSYTGPNSPSMGLCSGSIIDKKWIISAAHCFRDDVTKIKIITNIDSKKHVLGFGRKFVNHPCFIQQDPNYDLIYDFNNYQNDIALVKTAKPIQLNAFTQPIGLARLRAFGQQGIIAGYGGYRNLQIPLEGTVVVIRCEPGSKMLCSEYFSYSESGDSGGALTTDDGLVGIISGTTFPVGKDSIFVDISLHFNWIQEVTGKNFTIDGPEITIS